MPPELFEEAVTAHDPGNVHIDGAKIVELYQKEGKVPAEGDGLFGFVPDIAEIVNRAIDMRGVNVHRLLSLVGAEVDRTVTNFRAVNFKRE